MTRNLPYDRAERVADGMLRLVSETIVTRLSDPRLCNVSITRVRMTKDLKIARVYFHTIDRSEEAVSRAGDGLESAKGFLKRVIAKELDLRYTPDIHFYYDEAVDLCEKIDSLFDGKEAL